MTQSRPHLCNGNFERNSTGVQHHNLPDDLTRVTCAPLSRPTTPRIHLLRIPTFTIHWDWAIHAQVSAPLTSQVGFG